MVVIFSDDIVHTDQDVLLDLLDVRRVDIGLAPKEKKYSPVNTRSINLNAEIST